MICNHQVGIRERCGTGRFLYVPCGRCIACRLNKGRAWSVRIMNEVKHVSASCFCTLTYNDAHLPANNSLSVEDIQKFMKRLRKNTGKKIRYFLGGEYGDENKRPHYHVIFFGLGKEDIAEIERAWYLGFVNVGDVTFDSAAYVAGYTLKKLSGNQASYYVERGIKPEFGLMSRGGKMGRGIGQSFMDSKANVDFVRNHGFMTAKDSKKVAVPRFYADQIWRTEDEKKDRHEKRQKVIAESFDNSRRKLGIEQCSGDEYKVADYQLTERAQGEVDLQKRQEMKRRRL